MAVARRVSPRPGGGRPIVVPGGWYPWGWGGYGFAGYYGFYDPWYYGGHGYGYRYNQPYYLRRDDGSVRLKVTPRDASVYVDGYYAGVVDDFDGFFQRLPLEPGPHRIEMQLDGYTPLTFDVRILPERRTTLEGDLEALAP
ncbi:MAG: PEGA domain-containing protein [Vicinamibacterales bacterium]